MFLFTRLTLVQEYGPILSEQGFDVVDDLKDITDAELASVGIENAEHRAGLLAAVASRTSTPLFGGKLSEDDLFVSPEALVIPETVVEASSADESKPAATTQHVRSGESE